MSKPPIKKLKMKFYQRNRKQCLESGQKGFLVTFNFNEKKCVEECYNLLTLYAYNEYYKLISQSFCQGANIDRIEKEIKALPEEKKDSQECRFQAVDTGVPNCVFIKTTLDNPVQIAEDMFKDIAENRKFKTQYLTRLVPIDAVCKAKYEDIVNTAGQLCDKYFLKEPTTFSIVFKKRFNNSLSRDQLIRELADLIHGKNVKNKVDLKHAKKSLIVEVIKGLCCLTVVEDYMKMKKYNLIELAKEWKEDDKQVQ